MQYYSTRQVATAEREFIRVHSDADRSSREWFFAKSEELCEDGTWHDWGDNRLQVEVLHSGYYFPCDEP